MRRARWSHFPSRTPTRLIAGALPFCVILILILGPTSSAAEKSLFAEEKEKNVRSLLQELLPISEQQIERFDSDVALVYEQNILEAKDESYKAYSNKVWWVRRGDAAHVTNQILDFPPGVKVEEVKAFRIRPGVYSREAVLSAKIERIDKDRIRIQKGDDESRLSNVVIGFETPQPGEVLAVSIRTKVNHPLWWNSWLVAGPDPVARAELRVKNDWKQAFTVFASRFPKGSLRNKTFAEEKDEKHVRDRAIWIDDIDPIRQEPFSPPAALQSPAFVTAWRATKIEFYGSWIWWQNSHWNQVASRMASFEGIVLEERSRAGLEAKRLTTGLDPIDAASVAYRFVRDEIRDRHVSFYGDELFTVDDVLEWRTGSVKERSFLLLAMLRSLGVKADVVWTHDPDKGSFFEDYPIRAQLNVPLVRAQIGEEYRWFDIDCRHCAPGEIPPRLRDGKALAYRANSNLLDEELRDKILRQAYANRQDPYSLYFNQLSRLKWCEFVPTPPQGRRKDGSIEETLSFEQVGAQTTANLALVSEGAASLRARACRSHDIQGAVEHWAASRFSAEDIEVATNDDATADTLVASARFDCPPLPQPMSDTWILPAAIVFGTPSISSWPDQRATSFFIESHIETTWVVRLPLPDGWNDIEPLAPIKLGTKVLIYTVDYVIDGRELIVTRTLKERPIWITSPRDLNLLGQRVMAINDFEASPLVLKRGGN